MIIIWNEGNVDWLHNIYLMIGMVDGACQMVKVLGSILYLNEDFQMASQLGGNSISIYLLIWLKHIQY